MGVLEDATTSVNRLFIYVNWLFIDMNRVVYSYHSTGPGAVSISALLIGLFIGKY